MDRAELRETIQNTLKKYNMDDREAAADELVVALSGPASTVASDEWKRICAAHESRERAEKAILDRLESALGITPNSRPEWITIARFLIEKESERCAETIETFAANCKLDPYNTPKMHQIAANPMLIKSNWIHVMAVNAPKDGRDYLRGIPEEEEEKEEEVSPELTRTDRVWLRVLEQMAVDMPKTTFAIYLLGSTPLSYQDGIFRVSVIGNFTRDWLEQRLTSTVNRLLTGILNDDVRVEFVLRDEAER